MNIKICSKCGEAKSLEGFNNSANAKDGKRSDCKKCVNLHAKIYRKKNRNVIAEKLRIWREKNKDHYKKWFAAKGETYKKYRRKWEKENPEKVAAMRKKRYKKLSKDFAFILNRRMSSGIWYSLKRGKMKKEASWLSLVDYTLEDLKKHLESQFTDEMSWESFMNGEIHIDHINPISSFNFDSTNDIGFKDCWSLDNLQPLFAIDNLRKGAQIVL